MIKKKTFIFLFLAIAIFFAKAEELSLENVKKLCESDPETVFAMIQKLYILENAEPIISIPQLKIFWLDDGTVQMYYENQMSVSIGTPPNNLLWYMDLTASDVIIAKLPEINPMPIVAGGVVLFCIGVLVGVFTSH